MKYLISRTSGTRNNQPCENAKKIILKKCRDIRGFKNKEEWLSRFPKDAKTILKWGTTKDGKPYRIINNCNLPLWVVEIKNLCNFVKKYGDIILSNPCEEYVGYDHLMRVEIYDDHRE